MIPSIPSLHPSADRGSGSIDSEMWLGSLVISVIIVVILVATAVATHS